MDRSKFNKGEYVKLWVKQDNLWVKGEIIQTDTLREILQVNIFPIKKKNIFWNGTISEAVIFVSMAFQDGKIR